MAEKRGESAAAVRAVERALDILACFTQEAPEKGVSEIGLETGLSKGTVHRLLTALASRKYVEQEPESGRYRLGIRLLELGAVVNRQLKYQEKAVPHLQQLVREIDETVAVASLDVEGASNVCTLVVEPPRAVRVTTAVGVRRLCHFGVGGLVLLAWQPEEVLDAVLPRDRLPAYTMWSVTDPMEYRWRLRTVRELGYAVERGEGFPDVTSLGAPIFDHSGKVVAAVIVIAPTHRMPDERIPGLLAKLLEATGRISADMGTPNHQTPAADGKGGKAAGAAP